MDVGLHRGNQEEKSRMTYSRIKEKENLHELEKSLINLYIESDDYMKFLLEAGIRFPSASKMMIIPFKIHFFRKCHPFKYYFSWLFLWASTLVSGSFIGNALISNTQCNGAPLGFLGGLFFLVVISGVFHILVGDRMSTIKWYEDGCPMDY